LRRLAPRLVHYRFLGLCPPEVPALRLAGIRVLVADHSSGPARPLRDPLPWRALKPARRRLYARWVNGYLAVSAYVARRLESQNLVPRAKITVVRNGVDLERFRPLDPAGRRALRQELVAAGPEAEVVAFAGQVNRDKGVDLLLGAAEGLLARRPRAVLALAGQGEMSPEVARTARARGDGRLVALGQMQGVERLFQAADVAVLPSVWEEAFAHTLVEAQACGLPVVASRIGGNPEAVEEGVTGLLVPPADAASLQAALELLLADGGRRRDMAAAARRRAESRFTIARSVEETAGLYARLLAP
jgi:glycosyltransferase involved in cell wall biosynthesis